MHNTPLEFYIMVPMSTGPQDAQKGDLLTLPTLARRDAPWPKQGRSERPKVVFPSLLVYVLL